MDTGWWVFVVSLGLTGGVLWAAEQAPVRFATVQTDWMVLVPHRPSLDGLARPPKTIRLLRTLPGDTVLCFELDNGTEPCATVNLFREGMGQ